MGSAFLAISLPKCPLCIAAWFAAFTGVGVSISVASAVRPALLIAGLLSIAGWLVRYRERDRQGRTS